MSAHGREILDYPSSVTDPQAPRKPTMVMGDKIVEFNADGKVVWEWDAFEHLDPYLLHYHTFQPYWAVRGYPGYADWTHGNGITFDAERDLVIASFKHLDALVAIDRKTKDIRWIFGDPKGWPEKYQSRILKPNITPMSRRREPSSIMTMACSKLGHLTARRSFPFIVATVALLRSRSILKQ
jgi:hypothetical protein